MVPKRQRHRIYKEMLRRAQDNMLWRSYNDGLCNFLSQSLSVFLYHSIINNIEDYPELLRFRPRNHVMNWPFWFPKTVRGLSKRITILKIAIKDTEPKKKVK